MEMTIRPTYKNFGLFVFVGENRAKLVFEGTEDECRQRRDEIQKGGNHEYCD